jgi:hypothetical protein
LFKGPIVYRLDCAGLDCAGLDSVGPDCAGPDRTCTCITRLWAPAVFCLTQLGAD